MTLHAFGPSILAVGILAFTFSAFGRNSSWARITASVVGIIASSRYVYWRYFYSLPLDQGLIRDLWAWMFFIFESLTILSTILVYGFMSRRIDRSWIVDQRSNSAMLTLPVDVFIATYNEPYEILERTILGAKAINHGDLRVWVLDDGAREWVKELAYELGAHYTFRIKGKHAKAGNVNHGLEVALSTGRKPQFILLLDADFVANTNMLKRTLPLFEEEDVGIVQTPQHFFNPDPLQSNLLCTTAWPDEQRFFFNELLPSKDAWGACFCCGTSAVFRVEAFLKSGGMATQTVTEDMLTTFQFQEVGYRTIYLNEQLSLGLAPEGMKEYITQRSRWCLGAIQQIYTRWSFAGKARIDWINRISSFDGVLYWSSGFLFKIMMISGPLIYWWTGTAVIDSTVDDLIYWLAPHVFVSIMFMGNLARNRVLPVMTDVSQLLPSFAIIRTVLMGLVKPFGHPFKVTAKGVSTNGVTIQWKLLMPFLLMAIGTALGMFVNVNAYSKLNGTPGYSVNVFWSIFNIAVLSIACCVCIELPKRRQTERFPADEAATININEEEIPCRIKDISVGGARLMFPHQKPPTLNQGILSMNDGSINVNFQYLRTVEDQMIIQFASDVQSHRTLTVKLFTGGYANEVEKIYPLKILRSLFQRMFA